MTSSADHLIPDLPGEKVFEGVSTLLILSPVDIAKAVEYWLNQVVMKNPIKVDCVSKGSGTVDRFEVKIEGK